MGNRNRTRLGILGGTFNPVHVGHLLIAQDALVGARLDQVWFMPCARPPHKVADRLAPALDRLRMLRRGIRGDRRFAVTDIEIRRGGRSYSVETLEVLRRLQPQADFYFIMGADSWLELGQWRDIARLAKLCRFVAVARPGCRPPRRNPYGVRVVPGHVCGVSSTEIRARCRRGQPIRYLVPDGVIRYIQAHKLYR